jgi:hypothetical protein
MENKLYDKPHFKEYLLFGSLAAIGYLIFAVIFLVNTRYENSYLLYFGNVIFVVIIAIHAFLLINRKLEGKSAGRMLISSHMSAIIGVIIAAVGSIIATYIVFGSLTVPRHPDTLVTNAPPNASADTAGDVLVMLLIYATVANFAVSAFVSVLISYVCKKNQTKDKPAELDRNIRMVEK